MPPQGANDVKRLTYPRGGGMLDLSRAVWRKSTRSGYQGCVEITFVDGYVAIRDSKKQGTGPVLLFSVAEWQAFLGGARAGEFDRP